VRCLEGGATVVLVERPRTGDIRRNGVVIEAVAKQDLRRDHGSDLTPHHLIIGATTGRAEQHRKPERDPDRQSWRGRWPLMETASVSIRVRSARGVEAATLRVIERRAGEQFRRVGLDDIADEEPAPVETLIGYANAGRCWVAFDENDEPVGYVVVDEVDANAHIEQVSVDPDREGTGVGRRLVERARNWAQDSGRNAVTLTTFADIPWNAPLYAHLGFVVLDEDDIGPELHALRREESARGLDNLMTRVFMRLTW
jgi:GNAT superfamily N-acetyltransferase